MPPGISPVPVFPGDAAVRLLDHDLARQGCLRQELRLVRPKLIVALGATAALSLFKKAITIKAVRAKWQQLPEGEVLVTVHPSFLLRQTDAAARRHEFDKFVADLVVVKERARGLDTSFAA